MSADTLQFGFGLPFCHKAVLRPHQLTQMFDA